MLSPGGARGVQKAELNGNGDSENNHGGSSRTYVLHRARCSQEDDQLLRQGCERSWELDGWMKTLPQPWTVAMEPTIRLWCLSPAAWAVPSSTSTVLMSNGGD